MSDVTQRITRALDERFAGAGMPDCPSTAWSVPAGTASSPHPRNRRSYGLGYAAALLATILAVGSIARASGDVSQAYARLLASVFASSTPIRPGIHAADRLTIAEAQRRMPFTIVEPAGLPAGTRLMYAHVVREKPVAQVQLQYQAHLQGRYYLLSFEESTAPIGPPQVRFELSDGPHTKHFFVPLRRWHDGPIVIDFFAHGFPDSMSADIERANTR
jgi:hypothetical protein